MTTDEDGLVESQLLGGSFEHFSLVSVAGYQSVHLHFALLADSVSSCCGLHVVLRVPIRVIDDDHICAGKVDADSSRLSRQQKHIPLLVGVIVSIDGCLSFLCLDLPVNPLILVLLPLQKLFDKLKHVCEL